MGNRRRRPEFFPRMTVRGKARRARQRWTTATYFPSVEVNQWQKADAAGEFVATVKAHGMRHAQQFALLCTNTTDGLGRPADMRDGRIDEYLRPHHDTVTLNVNPPTPATIWAAPSSVAAPNAQDLAGWESVGTADGGVTLGFDGAEDGDITVLESWGGQKVMTLEMTPTDPGSFDDLFDSLFADVEQCTTCAYGDHRPDGKCHARN